ncbi:MAG: Ig-like domain-containing protein, partial [Erysipelotrichaceae bacterium]|nr:Ig-like domain-containing protein [Erysipelotrichaceae bacterium]
LGAKTTGNGMLTYKTSNKKVAKVSSKGTVTGVKKGKVTITITASATGANEKATKKVTVTVK